MPYIRPEDRKKYNKVFEDLPVPSKAGELNYLITTICSMYSMYAIDYETINEIIGVLECLKLEFYRRLAAPYEDKKKDENGDVY